jgi:hypothetical protein
MTNFALPNNSRCLCHVSWPLLIGRPSFANTLPCLGPTPSPQAQTGQSLEVLVQQGNDLRLTEHGQTSYATQHRLVQSRMSNAKRTTSMLHHKTNLIEFQRNGRPPRCLTPADHGQEISHPTIADIEHLFRELDNLFSHSTNPYAHATSSNYSRGRGTSRYTPCPRETTITDHTCPF